MSWRRRPRVKKLARKQDAKRLIAATEFRDYVTDSRGRLLDLGASTRRDAVIALASVPESDHVDIGASLVHALDDPSVQTRRAAAWALGARGELRGVDALREAAMDGSDVATEAVRVLVELAPAGGVEPFVAGFIRRGGDPDRVREILDQMLEGCDADAPAGLRGVATASLNSDVPDRGDTEVRERATQVLAWLGLDSVEVLLDVATHPGPARLAAIRAVGSLRDLRCTDALLELLDDPDPEVRGEAAWALGEISDQRATARLLNAASDPVYEVRKHVQAALRRLAPITLPDDARAEHSQPARSKHRRPPWVAGS